MSLIRSLVLFTAIALAFYLWVVWDPVGIYGSIRQYLEHPIRAPLEWIVVLFALSWIIQRGGAGYEFAVVILLPLFSLILALSRPDYGVSFWRTFSHEIYLPPLYVPRGLLIYFFLLVFILLLVRMSAGSGRNGKVLVYLAVIFLLTSGEAVFLE